MNKPLNEKIYFNQGNINVLNSIPEEAFYILDIGCGAGGNAKVLKGNTRIVDGITLSEAEAEEAKKYCRRVYLHDIENGLPEGLDEKYDVIICSHILEHIRYPEQVLREIRIKLKEDSLLIVALPNIMAYKSRIRLMLGKFEYNEAGVMDYTHLRWYTFKSGKKLLEENGFIVEKAWVEGGIPFGRVSKLLNPEIQRIIKKILFGIAPGFFGGELLYIAKIDN